MQADGVAATRHLRAELVVAQQLLTEEEERGARAGGVERVEDRRGGVGVRAVVEGEGDP